MLGLEDSWSQWHSLLPSRGTWSPWDQRRLLSQGVCVEGWRCWGGASGAGRRWGGRLLRARTSCGSTQGPRGRVGDVHGPDTMLLNISVPETMPGAPEPSQNVSPALS